MPFSLLSDALVVPLGGEAVATPSSRGAMRDLGLVEDELYVKDGDLVVVRGSAAIAQDLASRLRFFQGEWFLDGAAGMPYFDQVGLKGARLAAVRAAFRRELLATPGVDEVLQLDLGLDRATRELSIRFRVSTAFGEIQGIT